MSEKREQCHITHPEYLAQRNKHTVSVRHTHCRVHKLEFTNNLGVLHRCFCRAVGAWDGPVWRPGTLPGPGGLPAEPALPSPTGVCVWHPEDHHPGGKRYHLVNACKVTQDSGFFSHFLRLFRLTNMRNSANLPVPMSERSKTLNMVDWMLTDCVKNVLIHPLKDHLKAPWSCLLLKFWLISVSVSILRISAFLAKVLIFNIGYSS